MKTLLNFIKSSSYFIIIFSIYIFPVYAEGSQSLSVTPPLFQLSVLPGDIWQSSVKIVNVNPYPLTVYAEVVNFAPTGEGGQGRFIPILEKSENKATIAEWIEMGSGPYTIAPEQTSDLSFFVEVPKDAAPGGHYAAILITTQPSAPTNGEVLSVQTAQTVTSLFFVRIEGDVDENGLIREFRTTKSFLPRPEAEFSLRFENKGNVHLQPKGDIVITNMWGTERGIIPVNYQTHFGNVLPNSIRDFTFVWKSEFGIADVGRYKAIATLAYGENGVKSVTTTTYFWVIPIKATLITVVTLALFIALIVWMIKAYVRRMLTLAGVDVTASEELKGSTLNYKKVSAPLRSGVLDLRQRLSDVEESIDMLSTIIQFVLQYKKFFISVVVLIGIFISAVLYISNATNKDKNYEFTISEPEKESLIKEESDLE
jgi:uncharacterized membrane protein